MAYFSKAQGAVGRSKNPHPGHMDRWSEWQSGVIAKIRTQKESAGKKSNKGGMKRGKRERDE